MGQGEYESGRTLGPGWKMMGVVGDHGPWWFGRYLILSTSISTCWAGTLSEYTHTSWTFFQLLPTAHLPNLISPLAAPAHLPMLHRSRPVPLLSTSVALVCPTIAHQCCSQNEPGKVRGSFSLFCLSFLPASRGRFMPRVTRGQGSGLG